MAKKKSVADIIKAGTQAVNNVFYSDKKETEKKEKKTSDLKNKTQNMYGTNTTPTSVAEPLKKATNSLVRKAISNIQTTVPFNRNVDARNLAQLDIVTELPKLQPNHIEAIITKHFPSDSVVKPSDARAIYDAQQQTGMSALAMLAIGGLESGYGTSEIARKTNNLWGWGATNDDPSGNARRFSSISDGAAMEYAKAFLRDYYDGYGAKSIYATGTGNNPANKGYAYENDGTIRTKWADDVGNIMGTFYRTAELAM